MGAAVRTNDHTRRLAGGEECDRAVPTLRALKLTHCPQFAPTAFPASVALLETNAIPDRS